MKPDYSLKEIKLFLRQQPPIKFEDIEEIPLNELLLSLLKLNRSTNTIYVSSGKLQTEKNRRRSIGDLFQIVHYYHPKITLTTLYTALLKAISENQVISSICMDTGMRVYRATKGNEKGFLNGSPTDEFGTDLSEFENFNLCHSNEDKWGYSYNEEHINFITI